MGNWFIELTHQLHWGDGGMVTAIGTLAWHIHVIRNISGFITKFIIGLKELHNATTIKYIFISVER